MNHEYDKIAELIEKSNRIMVFTGAGISTNSGIPDFRSETGLYALLDKEFDLPYPEAIFDIRYFQKDPAPFFKISKDLIKSDYQPTECHRLIAELEKRGKIEIVVTQNIDMLHQKAGTNRLVECHGSFETAHCLECAKEYNLSDIKETLLQGEVPLCSCSGIIKPDVIFFGEQLPASFYEIMITPPQGDLLLILGSSLVVHPAAGFALWYIN
ncbi:MAG: Sir2 family NAD-dependent protein deacetylase, partial [Chitinivibrionales bacterium]